MVFETDVDNHFESLIKDICFKKYEQFVLWIDEAHPDGEDNQDSPKAIELWEALQEKNV